MRRLLPLLALPLAACVEAGPDVVYEDAYTLDHPLGVDVLFVVDDSSTMDPLQTRIAEHAGTFLDLLDARSLDWRVGVTTTDFDSPDRRGRLVAPVIGPGDDAEDALAAALRVGLDGSPIERGLAAADAALTPPLSTHDNAGLARDGAALAVVFVSDEDDCSDDGLFEDGGDCVTLPHELVPVSEYRDRLWDLAGGPQGVQAHSIVETGPIPGSEGCGGSNPGSRYMALSWATGGAVHAVCDDMAATLTDVAQRAAGLRSSFPLGRTPDLSTLVVRVEPAGLEGGSCGDASLGEQVPEDPSRENGWEYDLPSNTVRLWGQSAATFGETVRLCYEVGLGT